nr:putative protein phosphatase 2c 25 [Quercus suber]
MDDFNSKNSLTTKKISSSLDLEFKRFYRKGRPFRFEAMWLKDSTCEDVIKQSWEGESSPNIDRGFNRKITACQLNLRAWNRNCFGHVRNTLAKKLKDLKWAEEEGCYASNPGKIYQLREEIQKLKYREETRESIVGSYAWKSILNARDVIRRGMVWRVGTWERVRIKEDRWLPDKSNGLITSPLTQMAAETKVSSLIDQDQVRWNEEVVRNLFLPHEAKSILAIPLSFRRTPDRIAWKHTPSDCQFLIMASDGLWDKVNDQEAVDVVLREKNLLMSCKKLVDMSSSRGSMDDITVMVIDLLNFVTTS